MTAARARDPIMVYSERLLRKGSVTEADLTQLDREARDKVTNAIEFVLASSPAPLSDALGDVFTERWVGYEPNAVR